MDGTLIDCKADEFIPIYVGALKKRFAREEECEKIIHTIVKGAEAMVRNDGSRTNREAFMQYAATVLKYPVDKLEREMTDFYETDYAAVKCVIKKKPEMIKAIETLKSKGYKLIVTTNPLFPPTRSVTVLNGADTIPNFSISSQATKRVRLQNPIRNITTKP